MTTGLFSRLHQHKPRLIRLYKHPKDGAANGLRVSTPRIGFDLHESEIKESCTNLICFPGAGIYDPHLGTSESIAREGTYDTPE
jgi:hypothetical protein